MQSETVAVQRQVADILLKHAGDGKGGCPCVSQREMAVQLGTSWNTVRSSLESLQAEGAIRIDRHRLIINKKTLEQITMKTVKLKTYVLLKASDGDLEQALGIIQHQPGVVMAEPVEGIADIIFAVQATDRESLAKLAVQAIAAVENVTEEIELLPVTGQAR